MMMTPIPVRLRTRLLMGSRKMFAVLSVAMMGAAFLPEAKALPRTWVSGQFSDNRVLQAAGTPAQVLYAVGIGSSTPHTTANGYTFQAWNNNTNPDVSFIGNSPNF